MPRRIEKLHPDTHPDYPIIVNFSGGRTSGFMSAYLKDRYGDRCIFIFTNTGKEHPGTLDFVDQVDKWLHLNLIWLEYRSRNKYAVVDYQTASRQGEPFEAMMREKGIPFRKGRKCTKDLKIRTTDRFLLDQGIQPRHRITALGIRADEPNRLGIYYYPLAEDLKVDVSFVREWWKRQPFDLAIPEHLGNCDFCFMKSIKKRRAIAAEFPDVPTWWNKMEKEVGGANDHYFDMHNHISVEEIVTGAKAELDQASIDFSCLCADHTGD